MGKSQKSHWLCECDCGETLITLSASLLNGRTTSCGCYKNEQVGNRSRKHGKTHTTEYHIWLSMNQRCSNPNVVQYDRYGGRGIKVCNRWKNSFELFLQDMGKRPKGHSIERKNNDGNYCPSNCIWATYKTQGRNKVNNHRLTFRGETKNISEWAEVIGINQSTLLFRIRRGWSIEKALTTPLRVQ